MSKPEPDKNGPFVEPDKVGSNEKKTALILIISLITFVISTLILTCLRNDLEYPVMRFLNLLARKYPILDHNVTFFVGNNLTSGVVFLCLIWYVWFDCTEPDYRRRILIGALGAVGAGICSRVLQLTLPTHLRPLHDPALSFLAPWGGNPNALNHWNSFPSDHGAMFFGLAAVIFFAKARVGYLAFAWALVMNAGRIYLGYHYPTDVLGGGALGVLTVSLLQGEHFRSLGSRLLSFEKSAAPVFYMTALFVSYQIVTLFSELRAVGELEMSFIKPLLQSLLHP